MTGDRWWMAQLAEKGTELSLFCRSLFTPLGQTMTCKGGKSGFAYVLILLLLQVQVLDIPEVHWRVEIDWPIERRHAWAERDRDAVGPQEQIWVLLDDPLLCQADGLQSLGGLVQ